MSRRGKTAIIVQARLESTRFPEKVLKEIDGMSVLEHVLTRCQLVPAADIVCCAVPENTANDIIAEVAGNTGAAVFRGAENDLLDRYFQAARFLEAENIMRVTSDCPFIDPDICNAVIELHADSGVDYACNNMPVAWPHGLDCEIFTFELLKRAADTETRAWVREHVTEWMREDESVSRTSLDGPGGGVELYRMTVDYPEDLEFARAIHGHSEKTDGILRYPDLITILEAHPDLLEINRSYTTDNRNPDTLPEHDIKRFSALLPGD